MARTLVQGAAVGVALAAASFAPAFADAVTFTWAPSAVISAPPTDTIQGANNFNVADFASINTNYSPSQFSETGALTVLNFLNGGDTVSTPGLGRDYSLYFTFSGHGVSFTLPPSPGGTTTAPFTDMTYTLWAQPTPTPNVTVGAGTVTLAPNSPAVPLAFGDLIHGYGTIVNTGSGYSPTANLDLTFAPCTSAGLGTCTGDESAFFVEPAPSSLNLLIGNFSATPTVVDTTTYPGIVNIIGGGGNLTLDVPEPASLLLLGSGLLGLGILRRQRGS